MKTYAERSCFSKAHVATWRRAVELVDRVSDRWGNELRCHELASAVLTCLQPCSGAELTHGKRGAIEHSWIVLYDQRGRGERSLVYTLLDVYAPGHLPSVLLIDPFAVHEQYVRGKPPRDDTDAGVISRLVSEMMQLTDGRDA